MGTDRLRPASSFRSKRLKMQSRDGNALAACDVVCSTIRTVLSAWLDAYPDDFRGAPHQAALGRLRQFAVDQLPSDGELLRRVGARLQQPARPRHGDSAGPPPHRRRPQSAGTQRSQRTSQSVSH